MKIHDLLEQGHKDWFKQRMGKVTASEFGNLVKASDFTMRTGEMPKHYLCEKLAEVWRGKPLIHTGSWATEQGQVREELAVPWYQFTFETKIRYVGFIETDDGISGCSPDGLIGDDCGIEIKCPEPATHVKYLLAGKVPIDYLPQVHFSMFVTGFPRWIFFSFNQGFPPLIVTVERDEEIQQKITAAITKFSADFKDARRILELIEETGEWKTRRAA